MYNNPTNQLYVSIGISIPILDLNSAIAEKDSNIRNYVQALSEYWQLYYKIRSLTGYDFKNNQKIEDNLPDR